jgi:hypothetical protein
MPFWIAKPMAGPTARRRIASWGESFQPVCFSFLSPQRDFIGGDLTLLNVGVLGSPSEPIETLKLAAAPTHPSQIATRITGDPFEFPLMKGSLDFFRETSWEDKDRWPRRSNQAGRVPRWRKAEGGVRWSIS